MLRHSTFTSTEAISIPMTAVSMVEFDCALLAQLHENMLEGKELGSKELECSLVVKVR